MSVWRRLVGGGDETIARARRPQALAASLETAPLEGIDWLGHTPEPTAPLLYRLLLRLAQLLLFGVARIHVTVTGRAHLPQGGYVVVSAGHRSWIDPLVLVSAVPIEPRVWFMGSGASAFDRRWKEDLLRRIGGLLPVWRGGTDIGVHVRSARAVTDAGGVLALFAEGRIGGPPDSPARMRSGAALLCLRTGAPIVPIAITGSDELYRRKRIRVDVLPPTSPGELLGAAWEGPAPAGTRAELRQAHLLTRALEARLAGAMATSYPLTVDPPGAPRRWRWLDRLMR